MENSVVYVISVLAAVAFSSFVMYDNEKMRSSRTALGIILLAALATPFINTITSFSELDIENYPICDGEYGNEVRDDTAKKAFLNGIKLAIADKFSIPKEYISVDCQGFSFEEMKAEKISVILSGKAAFSDVRAVREYIKNSDLGECEVFISFE